jgi:hypothetical protein
VKWGRTFGGWTRRRDNIRDWGPLKGETILKAD